ncbi:hypothetical protein L1887_00807 [Cichorium endivia]|nr:hypothetical protein L1887_00807 [Cichorium endivia]
MEKKEAIAALIFNQSSPVRKKSERILKKTAFSKFTNEASNPVLVDLDICSSPSKESYEPSTKKVCYTKSSIISSPSKKVTDRGVPMEGHTNIYYEIGSKKRCQKPSTTEPSSSLKSKKSKDDNYITEVASKDQQTFNRSTRSKTHRVKAGAVDPPVVHGAKKKTRVSNSKVVNPVCVSDDDFQAPPHTLKDIPDPRKKPKTKPQIINPSKKPKTKPEINRE